MIQHLSGCNKTVELLWGMSWDQLLQLLCPRLEAGQQKQSLQPAPSFCLLANLITGDSLPTAEKKEAIGRINKKR